MRKMLRKKIQGKYQQLAYLAMGRNDAPIEQCKWDELMAHDDDKY